jgi:hypothetical protein
VAYHNVTLTDRVDASFFVQNTLPIWQIIGFAHIGCRMTGASGGLHMLNSSQAGGFNNRVSLCTWTETIRQCDLYNGLGSNQSSPNIPFTQPNARLSTGYGDETPGCHTIIGQNVVEAGSFEMNVSSFVEGNPGYNKENKNFIFHRNIFLRGSDIFNGFIFGSVTGVWARLNIACVTPTRTSTQFSFAAAYQAAQLLYLNTLGGYATGAGNNPVKAYSNTLVSFSDYSGDLATQTAGIVFIADTAPDVVISANNLLHREYGASPVSIGPLVGEVVATPRHQGFRNYVNTTMEPRTIPATHYVDVTGVTGTYNEGTTSNIVTLTAPGTVTASIGQVINTGGSTRRLYLYNVTGTIANGATVSVSGGNGGGSGTANGAMQATNFFRLWQTTSDPGADAGQPFARVGFFGGFQTTAFRGALPQAV